MTGPANPRARGDGGPKPRGRTRSRPTAPRPRCLQCGRSLDDDEVGEMVASEGGGFALCDDCARGLLIVMERPPGIRYTAEQIRQLGKDARPSRR